MFSNNFRSIDFLIDRYKKSSLAKYGDCLSNKGRYKINKKDKGIIFQTYFGDYTGIPHLDLKLVIPHSISVKPYRQRRYFMRIPIINDEILPYLDYITEFNKLSNIFYEYIIKANNNSAIPFFRFLMKYLKDDKGQVITKRGGIHFPWYHGQKPMYVKTIVNLYDHYHISKRMIKFAKEIPFIDEKCIKWLYNNHYTLRRTSKNSGYAGSNIFMHLTKHN